MARKEPTREMKINRIMSHLEEAVEDLDEVYLDDLLSIAQQFHLLAMEQAKIRMDNLYKNPPGAMPPGLLFI